MQICGITMFVRKVDHPLPLVTTCLGPDSLLYVIFFSLPSPPRSTLFFFLMMRPPPRSTLFPYPTLFRSLQHFVLALRPQHFHGLFYGPWRCKTLRPVRNPVSRQRNQRGILRQHVPVHRFQRVGCREIGRAHV